MSDYQTDCVCPWCGCEFSDSWEWFSGGNEDEEIKCDNCDKMFIASVNYDVTYRTKKIEEALP